MKLMVSAILGENMEQVGELFNMRLHLNIAIFITSMHIRQTA